MTMFDRVDQVGFKLDPTMFSSPEKQQLPLERCMRILPHHQVRLLVLVRKPFCRCSMRQRAALGPKQQHRSRCR